MKSIPKISLLVLGLLSILIGIIFYAGGYSGSIQSGTKTIDVPTYTNVLIFWAYILIGLSIAITLILVGVKFFKKFASDVKSGLKSLATIALLAAIFLVTFLFGSAEKIEIIGYKGTDNEGFWAQFSDMCMYSIYTFIIGTFVTIIAVNVYKQIKK